MYSGRVDVDNINPAKIMKLITASDLYQVMINREGSVFFVNQGFLKVENVREGLEATLMENVKEDTAVDYLIFR